MEEMKARESLKCGGREINMLGKKYVVFFDYKAHEALELKYKMGILELSQKYMEGIGLKYEVLHEVLWQGLQRFHADDFEESDRGGFILNDVEQDVLADALLNGTVESDDEIRERHRELDKALTNLIDLAAKKAAAMTGLGKQSESDSSGESSNLQHEESSDSTDQNSGDSPADK